MFDIIFLMLPIFALIATGSLFIWQGWFPEHGLPLLSKFVLNACIPVLLFSAITNGQSLGTFAWINTLLYAGASLIGSFILWLILRRRLGEQPAQSLILAMGAGCANSVFLGFPIASIFIPDRAASVFAWVVLAEIAILLPLFTTLALLVDDQSEQSVLPRVANTLFRSPIFIGLVSGFAALATGFQLPNWLSNTTKLIAASAAFPALFVIGGTLLKFRVSRTGPRVAAITAVKLLVHPLLVGISFALVFGWESVTTKDAVLFACMPLFLAYVVLAGKHQADEVAASAIALSTLLSAVTVTLVLIILY